MHKTIEAGYQEYLDELVAYKKWADPLLAVQPNPMMWGETDYQKITGWNEKIKGMELALGLSKPEIADACRQVGITLPE